MKSMLFFDLIDLFAECRLGDVQSVSGPSEIKLLGQDEDCLQVTYFAPGEHGSKPPFAKRQRFDTALHLVKEPEGKKKYQKELLDSGGVRSPETENDTRDDPRRRMLDRRSFRMARFLAI